ncbi:transmembrane protein, putative [Bodo saltans]|uniref:Transmembrane protein, putative n=1 Tax=Bodo saltans TaxID=75058 RepID=A0A0S4JJ46_BODSA|nr:transmembrane protein, putative [Bodo saltans]|eukprot:CUG89953.1 transmembrane protein, putative [Bodo saltans]
MLPRDFEMVQSTIQLTGLVISDAKTLSITLSGAGAVSYTMSRSSWEVPVHEQSFAGVLSSPVTVLVGQTSTIRFGLTTLPVSRNDTVVLQLLPSPTISFAVTSLTTAVPETDVAFTALAGGSASLWSLVHVVSTRGQYENRLYNNPTVVVLTMGSVVVSPAPELMYQGQSVTMNFELSQAPQLPGTSLVVTPVSSNGGFFTPATITYTGSTIHQTAVFTATTIGATNLSFSLDGTAASTYETAPNQHLTVSPKLRVVLFFTADASEIRVAQSLTLTVGIDSPITSVTGNMSVIFTYGTGREINFSTPIVFSPNSSQTSGTFTMTGTSPMANGTLAMSFSGPGASSYYADTSAWTVTVDPLPFNTCSSVLAIPFNSKGFKNSDCALCANGANGNLPQCAVESQCYCAGTTPSCQYQFAFLGCTSITNTTPAYSAADCMTCIKGSCNPACLADVCVCTTANFGNNNALDALSGATGTTDPTINAAVIAFCVIASVAVVGGAAFFIIRHLRSAAAAAKAATAAKTNPASGGESGVLPPMQPYFSTSPNPLDSPAPGVHLE